MRVALVGLAAGSRFQEMAGVVNPRKQDYCNQHGYDFIHFDRPFDAQRPMPWSKIPAVLRVLPHYDWVLWHDTDTVMWNPHRIETFIQACGDAICLIQGDGLGLNSGVFLIKNVPRAHQFLAEAWRRTDLIHATVWEQAAITELSESESWRSEIRYFTDTEMSPGLQKCFLVPHESGWDSLFLHLAGFHDRRLERLRNLVKLSAVPQGQRLHQTDDLGLFLNRRNMLGRGVAIGVSNPTRARTIMSKWNGARLDVIDPWIERDDIIRTTYEAEERRKTTATLPEWESPQSKLQLHKQLSRRTAQDVPNSSLDFVCIDGAHSAGGFSAELGVWLPKVKSGGLIAGTCGPRTRIPIAEESPPDELSAPVERSSVPQEIQSWCHERDISVGVTADWPEPTWFFTK